MKTLHVLRKRNDHLAEAEICSESSAGGKGHSVSVLLIQDAVLGYPAVPVPVYVNTQDLQARGVSRPYGTTEGPMLSPPQLESEDLALPGQARGVGGTCVPPPAPACPAGRGRAGAGRSEDGPKRTPHGPPHIIDYEEICRMIVEHDRIVVW